MFSKCSQKRAESLKKKYKKFKISYYEKTHKPTKQLIKSEKNM